jgi:hypothetical protein
MVKENLYGSCRLRRCIELRQSSKYIDSGLSASKATVEDSLVERRVASNI